MHNQTAIKETLRIINSLPQRRHINDLQIRTFIERAAVADPERMQWLADRLKGIGGSEIGALIAAMLDKYSFNSPQDIVRDKLLLNYPEPSNGHCQRGNDLEAIVAAKCIKAYNAVRDEESLNKVAAYVPDDKEPWLVGNPDDILIIGGKRYLNDYKVPQSGKAGFYHRNGVPFEYACQLHHYNMICEKVGVKIDGFLCTPFDCDRWHEVVAIEVPFDAKINEQILKAGNYYWDFVLKGQVPDYVKKSKRQVSSEDAPAKWHELSQQQAAFQLLANAATDQAELCKGMLIDLAGDYDMSSTRIELGVINVTGKQTMVPNEEKLQRTLASMKVDLSDCTFKNTQLLDGKKMLKKLTELNSENPNFNSREYMSASTKITSMLSRASKGRVADTITNLRKEAGDTAKKSVKSLIEAQQSYSEDMLLNKRPPSIKASNTSTNATPLANEHPQKPETQRAEEEEKPSYTPIAPSII